MSGVPPSTTDETGDRREEEHPIYESLLVGVFWTALACLRSFRDDKGRSVVDRGLDETRTAVRQATWLTVPGTRRRYPDRLSLLQRRMVMVRPPQRPMGPVRPAAFLVNSTRRGPGHRARSARAGRPRHRGGIPLTSLRAGGSSFLLTSDGSQLSPQKVPVLVKSVHFSNARSGRWLVGVRGGCVAADGCR